MRFLAAVGLVSLSLSLGCSQASDEDIGSDDGALTKSGSIDQTYTTSGGRGVNGFGIRTGVAFSKSGRAVVMNLDLNGPSFHFVSRLPDGKPDTAAGPEGRAELTIKQAPLRVSAVVEDDGSILFYGGYDRIFSDNFNPTGIMLRVTNGKLDPSFGNGVVAGNGFVSSVQVDHDAAGKVVGYFVHVQDRGNNSGRVRHYSATGEFDRSFGDGGDRVFDTYASLVGIDDSGIYVQRSEKGACVVSRLLKTGAPDSTFGVDGTVTVSAIQPDNYYWCEARREDTGSVIVLVTESSGDGKVTRVSRLDDKGTPTDLFPGVSHLDVPWAELISASTGQLVLRSEGKLSRWNPSGSLDSTWKPEAVLGPGESFQSGRVTNSGEFMLASWNNGALEWKVRRLTK